MSLGFFTDAAMTRPINLTTYKRFCLPLTGGSKNSVVYLGDPFSTLSTASVTSGASTLYLQNTTEFLSAGTASINGTNFTYTGLTSNSLTGCVGLPAATTSSLVVPCKVYKPAGNIFITPTGTAYSNQFNIQLSPNYPAVGFGFSQNPALYSQTSLQVGTAIPLYIQVNMTSGTELEVIGWTISTCGFAVRDLSNITVPGSTEGLIQAVVYGYAYRGLQSPNFNERVIQLSRQIENINPGFTIGQYRWRTSATTNGFGFIPPNWDLDPIAIGINKFQSGYGYGSDLYLSDVTNQNSSIYPSLTPGQYFYGPFRNYLQGTTQIEIIPGTSKTHQLLNSPTTQTPIQVGVWQLSSSQAYIPYLTYTQVATTLNQDGSARTDLPENYFTINRVTNVLTINSVTTTQTAFLGAYSTSNTYFNLPYYPITSVISAYCDYGGAKPRVYSTNYVINQTNRTINVTIPGANLGDSIYIDFQLNLAVIYDVGEPGLPRLETSVDLNPAYAGIATGYYYIEQRLRQTESIILSCDKQIVDIPSSFSSVSNLIAYGPVYLQNDYALLTATAYTAVAGEVNPNASLLVIPGENFSGTINYLNPVAEQVIVETGGDGKANLIYTPEGLGGFYIPATAASGSLSGLATTTVTNDTLVLPEALPIAQIWNASNGWLVYTYNVLNNQPFFGQVGANTAIGEIPYATTGTSGTINYYSNGALSIWTLGNNIIYPINALDSAGRSYTNNAFNGLVSKLVYATSLTISSAIPCYYINFLQLISLMVQDINTGVYSNSILIELQPPTIIQDNPWLYLNNATEGIINQFRLGWISPGV